MVPGGFRSLLHGSPATPQNERTPMCLSWGIQVFTCKTGKVDTVSAPKERTCKYVVPNVKQLCRAGGKREGVSSPT